MKWDKYLEGLKKDNPIVTWSSVTTKRHVCNIIGRNSSPLKCGRSLFQRFPDDLKTIITDDTVNNTENLYGTLHHNYVSYNKDFCKKHGNPYYEPTIMVCDAEDYSLKHVMCLNHVYCMLIWKSLSFENYLSKKQQFLSFMTWIYHIKTPRNVQYKKVHAASTIANILQSSVLSVKWNYKLSV